MRRSQQEAARMTDEILATISSQNKRILAQLDSIERRIERALDTVPSANEFAALYRLYHVLEQRLHKVEEHVEIESRAIDAHHDGYDPQPEGGRYVSMA